MINTDYQQDDGFVNVASSILSNLSTDAIFSATMKAKNKNTANTWQQRTPFQQFTDLFPGDLAKNVVADYLNVIQSIVTVNYDKVRTDGFKYNDQYDLLLGQDKIEVKSSLEKQLQNPKAIKNNRRIIIYSELQGISAYIFQVYYLTKNSSSTFCNDLERLKEDELKTKYSISSEADFARVFENEVNAYIMAYTDRAQAEIYKRERRFFTFGAPRQGETKRQYLDLYLRDCYSPETFQKHIVKL